VPWEQFCNFCEELILSAKHKLNKLQASGNHSTNHKKQKTPANGGVNPICNVSSHMRSDGAKYKFLSSPQSPAIIFDFCQ